MPPLVRCAALTALVASPGLAQGFVGRWDMTMTAGSRTFPSWMEVHLSGNRTLVGQFVHDGGSARPVGEYLVAGDTIRFSLPPQWEQRTTPLVFEGVREADGIRGWTTDGRGQRITWIATRAPSLARTSPTVWGRPVRLFTGKDLAGWHADGAKNNWKAEGGVLVNGAPGANLVTDATFTDFKLHVEFRYPKNGNSGVYLRGRHEVQVEDSKGMELASTHLGGIYGFIAPSFDAAKGADAWQTFDITLIGRRVTVMLNGQTIICDREIPGITGGAIDSNEGAPGPIYLQGDHTSVQYRNLVLTPAK